MVIRSIRRLDGPNVFNHRPVLIMELDLEEFAERETRDLPGLNDRLLALLPGLHAHGCARGTPGAFVERLRTGTYFGHAIEHVALELSEPAGASVTYGKTVGTGVGGVYQVAVEFTCAPVMHFLLETAVDLVGTLARGEAYTRLDERLNAARRIVKETALGPSTHAIVEAAIGRGIPVHRLNDRSLVQLGYGARRQLVEATIASTTSAVAMEIASDKQLTRELLQRAYLPVPRGEIAETEDAAVRILDELESPVAVKPRNGNQGKGVSLGVRTPEE